MNGENVLQVKMRSFEEALTRVKESPPSDLTLIERDIRNRGRIDAAEHLAWIGDVKAIPVLTEVLKDKSYEVKKAAIKAIGIIAEKNPGNPEVARAVPALGKVFESTGYEYGGTHLLSLRSSAVEALKKIGGPEAVSVLKQVQWHHHIRIEVIRALGEIGTAGEVFQTMIGAAKDRNARVQEAAIEALGRFKLVEAVSALLEASEIGGTTFATGIAIGNVLKNCETAEQLEKLEKSFMQFIEEKRIRIRIAKDNGVLLDGTVRPPKKKNVKVGKGRKMKV